MQWQSASMCSVISLMQLMNASGVHAKQYISVEEAKQLFFRDQLLKEVKVSIPKKLQDQIRRESGVRHSLDAVKLWKSEQGSWLIVDDVVGKHEMITYAVGIDTQGVIQGIEILQYNESYGGQIREKKWLKQFEGRSSADQLRFNQDIWNMTGATLSSKHVTDGVRRVMILYQNLLKEIR
jgi:Na+-translocating ferredoxin:NAD+ oxidoreductase RnfG subunit